MNRDRVERETLSPKPAEPEVILSPGSPLCQHLTESSHSLDEGREHPYGLSRKGTTRTNDLWRILSAGSEAQKLEIGITGLFIKPLQNHHNSMTLSACAPPILRLSWGMRLSDDLG